jgi:hypothetical protein
MVITKRTMNKSKFEDLEIHLENLGTRELGFSATRVSQNEISILLGFDHDYGKMDDAMEGFFHDEIEHIADKFNLRIFQAGWNDDYSLNATLIG